MIEPKSSVRFIDNLRAQAVQDVCRARGGVRRGLLRTWRVPRAAPSPMRCRTLLRTDSVDARTSGLQRARGVRDLVGGCPSRARRPPGRRGIARSHGLRQHARCGSSAGDLSEDIDAGSDADLMHAGALARNFHSHAR
jgi:hypothetical protein